MYKHDDSDTTMDKIELRITDGGPPGPLGHTNRFTIPILVIPKDDSVPLVISNLLIRVRWGQQVVIRRHMLEASDLDTSGQSYLKIIKMENRNSAFPLVECIKKSYLR